MFCTVCATANARSARHCSACGATLREQTGRREDGKTGRKRRSTRLPVSPSSRLLLAIVLPLTMALAGGGYWWAERSAQAAAYERGEAALAVGDPEAALSAFADARGYRDAAGRRAEIETELAPFRPLYVAGLVALDAGDEAEAIAALLPVVQAFPGYQDATAELARARTAQVDELKLAVETAVAGGDWLAAERALAALVVADPGDPSHAERLATVRREHAPILFTRENRIQTIGPDGQDERIISGTDGLAASWPVWSPDRTRIAFVSSDTSGLLSLYVVGTDGTGLRRLGEELRPYDAPVWSPDGNRIAYLSTERVPEEPEPVALEIDPNFAAYFGSALYQTTEATPAAESGSGGLVPQNGQTPPAVATGPGVRVVDLATGEVTDPGGGRIPNARSPSWSPAGDRLALISRSGELTDQLTGHVAAGELYVVTLATGEVAAPAAGQIRYPWQVAWSPGAGAESLVVWTRAEGDPYDANRTPLWLVDARTGALRDLNPGLAAVTMPVWSPDGQAIAYLENELRIRARVIPEVPGERNPGVHDLMVPLPEAVTEFLSWSPDGTAIVVAGGGQFSRIVHMNGWVETFPLAYDVNRRQGGPPQWSPIAPMPEARPVSVGGTARDAT